MKVLESNQIQAKTRADGPLEKSETRGDPLSWLFPCEHFHAGQGERARAESRSLAGVRNPQGEGRVQGCRYNCKWKEESLERRRRRGSPELPTHWLQINGGFLNSACTGETTRGPVENSCWKASCFNTEQRRQQLVQCWGDSV